MQISKKTFNTLFTIGAVASILMVGSAACKLAYEKGEETGVEEGRYAMRQHIDNVRWLKMFNTWSDAYDAYATDTLKKIAAGKPVSDEDRAAVRDAPKIDREKTFGKVMKMVKDGAGKDPLEASWLKANGFSD